MSRDARRTKKRRDISEWPGVEWVLGLSPAWQTGLGLGLVVVAIVGLYQLCGVSDMLEPLPPLSTPTQTLPPGTTRTPAVVLTATPVATATPTPEPQIAIGGHAVVYGTGEDKLRCRAAPGVEETLVTILDEGARLKVLDGPQSADDHEWWKVEAEDGQVGWVASDWLLPVSD